MRRKTFFLGGRWGWPASAYHTYLHGYFILYKKDTRKILVIRWRGYLSIPLYLPLSKREHSLLVTLFWCLPVVRGG